MTYVAERNSYSEEYRGNMEACIAINFGKDPIRKLVQST